MTNSPQPIYLDHASSTPPKAVVTQNCLSAMTEFYGNADSPHHFGIQHKQLINQAKSSLRLQLGGAHEEIIFTSSASESNRSIIHQFEAMKSVDLTASHPSVNHQNKTLKLDDSVRLVFIEHIHHLTGEVFDLKKEIPFIKKQSPQAHIHLDASQSFTKISLAPIGDLVDSITLSARKMGGPQGIAALALKSNKNWSPFLGNGVNPHQLRISTMNTGLIRLWHLSWESDILSQNWDSPNRLKEMLKQRLLEIDPEAQFPFEQTHTSPYILGVVFPRIPSGVLVREFSEQGVYISQGAACSGNKANSHSHRSLLNKGLSQQQALCFLRFSLGAETTEAEILEAMDRVEKTLKKYRGVFK